MRRVFPVRQWKKRARELGQMSEPRWQDRLESTSVLEFPMAPRANESEKVSFNQLNRKTGHRIKYSKVDADTGEEVANEDIVKGYKVDTDTFVDPDDRDR
jgi:non-homologous end joining protein Ku